MDDLLELHYIVLSSHVNLSSQDHHTPSNVATSAQQSLPNRLLIVTIHIVFLDQYLSFFKNAGSEE